MTASPHPALDIADIERVVPAFYARVLQDALIGPVFDAAIEDWDHHLALLVDFWSSIMLTTGRYKGQPVAAHVKHKSRLTPAMFARWLAIWRAVTSELVPGAAAAALQAKADRIGQSLALALWFRLPEPPSNDSAQSPPYLEGSPP